MSRRIHSREAGLLEVAMDLAWASPIAGFVASLFFFVAASVFTYLGSNAELPMSLLAPIMGLIFNLVGICCVFVSVIALIRDAFLGR